MSKENYCKVKDLKKVLESYPDDMIVFLSVDEEGNELKPLPSERFYSDEKVWDNDIKDWLLDDFEDEEKVVCLWPIG